MNTTIRTTTAKTLLELSRFVGKCRSITLFLLAITYFLLQSVSSFAQHECRPIIDSTAGPKWLVSAAPLGDTSTYIYPDSVGWTGTTLTLRHVNNQDSLLVSNVTRSPKGVHIYRVDSIPCVTTGISGTANNDRYFGVFSVKDSSDSVQYSVTYYYAGSPYSYCRPGLYKRHDNADSLWVNTSANWDFSVKTLVKDTELYRSEYIIANDSGLALGTKITSSGSLCNGSSTTLTASSASAISYLWSTGDTTISITVKPDSTTLYSLKTFNAFCSDSIGVTIVVNANPSVTIAAGGPVNFCQGGNVLLTATTLATVNTYSWSTGDTVPSITVASTGNYKVTVTDSNLCKKDTVIQVTVDSVVTASIAGNTVCKGQEAILTASGGKTYSWNNGAATSSITIATPDSTTTYTVTVYNGTCSNNTSVKITVNPVPVITHTPDTNTKYGTPITLSANGGSAYTWSPATTLSCSDCQSPIATPLATTLYYITVNNAYGCASKDSIKVVVDGHCEVFIPTAFSPNKDGHNDELQVHGDCIKTLTFMVFDRWGEKVFEATDIKQHWDGTYKGKLMNTAVFVYYLEATLYDETPVTEKGTVSLIR